MKYLTLALLLFSSFSLAQEDLVFFSNNPTTNGCPGIITYELEDHSKFPPVVVARPILPARTGDSTTLLGFEISVSWALNPGAVYTPVAGSDFVATDMANCKVCSCTSQLIVTRCANTVGAAASCVPKDPNNRITHWSITK